MGCLGMDKGRVVVVPLTLPLASRVLGSKGRDEGRYEEMGVLDVGRRWSEDLG